MDLNQLEKRLSLLETRLASIENKINLNISSTTPQVPIDFKGNPVEQSSQIQAIKSGNWLGMITLICSVLAAGFIIQLSIDSGWLTSIKQLGLAALLGFLLIGIGISFINSNRIYASRLPAVGIVLLYLTIFVGYRYYSILSFRAAIALISLNSGLSIWFYNKLKHDLYAIIAALGAYIGPLLLSPNVNTVFSLYYLIICSFTFALVSICLQSRTLTLISAYLAILITSYIGIELDQDLLVAIVLPLYFLIFTGSTYFYTQLTRQELTLGESLSLLPVLLIFYAMEYYFIDRIQPQLAPWISLIFAALLIILFLSAKKWFPERSFKSQTAMLAFTTIVCFHSIYLELLPLDFRPWLFVLILLATSYLIKYKSAEIPRAYFFPAAAVLILLTIEYGSMILHLLGDFNLNWFIVSCLSFVSLWILLISYRTLSIKREEISYLLLGLAHLLAIVILFQVTHYYGPLVLTASWLGYAVIIFGFSLIAKDKIIAKSALFVLILTAVKALVYDSYSRSTLIRILVLFVTIAVIYAASLVIRKQPS